jgi:hypothetical protein
MWLNRYSMHPMDKKTVLMNSKTFGCQIAEVFFYHIFLSCMPSHRYIIRFVLSPDDENYHVSYLMYVS